MLTASKHSSHSNPEVVCTLSVYTEDEYPPVPTGEENCWPQC
jgi:hypothetical protein